MKGLLPFAVISLLTAATTYAYEGFGICNFGKEKVPAVICYGPTVLNETVVSGDVKIAGPLKAYKVLIGPLTVNGTADIQNSIVTGPVNINGYLRASHVNFAKDLMINAAKLDLNHTVVKGSVTMSSETVKPYFKMKCGARIMGSVVFDRLSGIVQMTDDSKVDGKIKNGEIEFTKEKCKTN